MFNNPADKFISAANKPTEKKDKKAIYMKLDLDIYDKLILLGKIHQSNMTQIIEQLIEKEYEDKKDFIAKYNELFRK